MFEKNIKALTNKNPLLADKLRKMNFNNISALESQSGDINIAYNNTLLHSEINPIEEANNIFSSKIKDNKKNDFHIILGLGLGYLFKRAFVSSIGKIILFEPYLDILRFTFEYVDFSQEIESNRVYVCNSVDEVLSVINDKHIIGDSIEISFLPAYSTIDPNIINSLTSKMINLLEDKKLDQQTILKKSNEWGFSALKNLNEISNSLPVDFLSTSFKDTPIVITGAGPSLLEDIEYLKKYKDKYLLITINSALKAVLENGLKPDFCVIVEHTLMDQQLKQLENLDKINFILHPRTQNLCWHFNKNNFYYLTNTDSFSNWYNKKLNAKYNFWPSAGSVTIIAFYLASKVLNAKNIIFTGLDLAYIEDKMYASEPFKNMKINIKGDRFIGEADLEGKNDHLFNIKLLKTKDKDGNEVITRPDYFHYLKQFEDIIANELPSDMNIINTSLKGAYIKGMTYKPINEVLDTLKNPAKPFSETIENLYNQNADEIEKNKRIFLPKIKKFYEEIEEIINAAQKAIKIIEEFDTAYSKSAQNKTLPTIIQRFYNQKEPIRKFISKEEIIFFILQKQQLDLTNNYIIPEGTQQLKIEDYKVNFKAEKCFLTEVMNILEQVKALNS